MTEGTESFMRKVLLPKKTFPSLSHSRKAIAVCCPSLTWSYLQGSPKGPRCFPEATIRCSAQLGFLTNALVDHLKFKHHLVMTALLEFPYAYDTGSPHKRNDFLHGASNLLRDTSFF